MRVPERFELRSAGLVLFNFAIIYIAIIDCAVC